MVVTNPSILARGLPGIHAGLYYLFDNVATMADPGDGGLRLDDSDMSAVTAGVISDLTADAGNPDVAAWIAALVASASDPKAWLSVIDGDDPANWARFEITGVTDETGWYEFALTYAGHSGVLSDGAALRVTFTPNGPAGPAGSNGAAWDQWQGGWQTAAAYVANDVVENDGSSYVCILDHTSGATDDEPGVGATQATYWDLVAAAGADGAGDVSGSVSSTDGNLPQFSCNSSTVLADSRLSLLDLFNIRGLVPANNGSDASHDLDISAGLALSDDGAALINLSSGITKRLDATFSEGTGNGGMLSGNSLPTSGTGHVWLIMKADGTVDVFANNAATDGLSPTPPAGFSYKRRIFSVTTDSSANIVAFTASELSGGGLNVYLVAIAAAPASPISVSTSASLTSLNVPIGIKLGAVVALRGSNTSSWGLLITSPDEQADTAVHTHTAFSLVGAAAEIATAEISATTNVSGEIRMRASGASTTTYVLIKSWQDTRRS